MITLRLFALANLERLLYGRDEYYELLTGNDAPEDWPSTSTPSTKYFKQDSGTGLYEGCTVSDVYAANTYYQKYAAVNPQLPSPAQVIELFGGTVDEAQG